MTVSSITSPTYTQASTPSSTRTSAGSTAQADAPTASTSVTLSALSEEAGIVATLGRASGTFQTYDATGLLNQVAQADMAAAGSAAAPSDPDAPSGDGTGTPVTTAVPGDWGSLLKSNPGLTSTAVADAVAQGIVNTISVYA